MPKIQLCKIAKLNANSISSKSIPAIVEYLDTGNITRNNVSNIQVIDTSKYKLPSRAQRRVKDKTIIYSTVRPNLEHYGFMDRPSSDLVVSTGFTTIDVIDDNYNPKYIYYLLTMPQRTDYLHTLAQSGVSAYPSINPSDLGDMVFDVPGRPTQDKVVSILEALDAKISINNKVNTELEALARDLYNYWFVQFDFPDDNQRPYKTAGGAMIYSEKLNRELPLGWRPAKLCDIANITMGQSPPGSSYNDSGEGVVFYQGSTDFGSRFPTVRLYTEQPSRYARKNDILLSVRAPVGTLNLAGEPCCIGRGLAALNSKTNSIAYLLEVMKDLKASFDRSNATGTTFGSISKDELLSLPILKPNDDILEHFESVARPIFERSNQLENETIALRATRDWLLPMLMNNQVSTD